MNKNDSRRKLLKSIVAGSSAVVAGKSLPESWSKPVMDAVVLPAHAATTEIESSPIAGTIICSSLDVAFGSRCRPTGTSFYVSGEVSASDGSSLEGVSLAVTYTNGARPTIISTTPPPTTTQAPDVGVPFTVLVGAGNVFSSVELFANPPDGTYWEDTTGTISVKFTDPKYGSSSCSVEYNCK